MSTQSEKEHTNNDEAVVNGDEPGAHIAKSDLATTQASDTNSDDVAVSEDEMSQASETGGTAAEGADHSAAPGQDANSEAAAFLEDVLAEVARVVEAKHGARMHDLPVTSQTDATHNGDYGFKQNV